MKEGKVQKDKKRRWWPFGKRTEASAERRAIAYDPKANESGTTRTK